MAEDEMVEWHHHLMDTSQSKLWEQVMEREMREVQKGWDKAQAGIKIAGRNINNLRYADDTTLMAESEEELKAS